MLVLYGGFLCVMVLCCVFLFFFFKQKTAYEMRISDWSSDVCSSDLLWTVASVESGPTASVTLTLTSPAGDQGYPGTLDVTVTYSLDRAGALTIDFGAK